MKLKSGTPIKLRSILIQKQQKKKSKEKKRKKEKKERKKNKEKIRIKLMYCTYKNLHT